MQSKEFKKIFTAAAQKNGFEKALGGWFRESKECIVSLDLQKSNYSNLYYLNIKIFVQGMFGNHYSRSKDLVKDTGDIFRRQSKDYDDAFDLDSSINDVERKLRLDTLFNEFINPFTKDALTKNGIRDLAHKGEIYLLPAVKKDLEQNCDSDHSV